MKGAIGVTNDSVEGCDITVPVCAFEDTKRISAAAFNTTLKLNYYNQTGHVNSGAWGVFAKGEVLFLGATGRQTGRDSVEITEKFAASPNRNSLTVGDITGIAKEGWHYLWVRYRDAVENSTLIKKPIAVYVERVYDYSSFAGLGSW
jgi:hypothetical protein